MPAADLPAEIWAVIALIAGLAVTMSLVVFANLHAYLLRVRKLRHDVRVLRARHKAALGSVDPVEEAESGPATEAEPAKKAA